MGTAFIIVLFLMSITFIFIGIMKGKKSKSRDKRTLNNLKIDSSNFRDTSGIDRNDSSKAIAQKCTVEFPDRTDAINWHVNAIERGFKIKDYDLVNLSYAKLIESVRQQNINNPGSFDDSLNLLIAEYELFRKHFNKDYPKQFLPPKGVKSIISDSPSHAMSEGFNKFYQQFKDFGYAENFLFRKDYSITSAVPSGDFSPWVIECIRSKDYSALSNFIDKYYEDKSQRNKLNVFLQKNLSEFLVVESNCYLEIQAFFIIRRGIDDTNTGYWIEKEKESTMLAKMISCYEIQMNLGGINKLISKANKFIKDGRKNGDFWKEYKYYSLDDFTGQYSLNLDTDLLSKLSKLPIGQRMHFFDYASRLHQREFWDGDSSYSTRLFGIIEKQSISTFLNSGLFIQSKDINYIPQVFSKGELKEIAEKNGFEIKKSWTLEKIFEYLKQSEEGSLFLSNQLATKTVLKFNPEYNADMARLLSYYQKIKPIADILCFI